MNIPVRTSQSAISLSPIPAKTPLVLPDKILFIGGIQR
jgi:hypothetical protein